MLTNIRKRAAKSSLIVGIAALAASSSAQAAVLISSGATTNIVCTSGVCTPTKKGAILNVTQLESLLASGNVTVTTAGATSSDIIVSAKLPWASSHNLTLDAYHSITIEKAVSMNGTGALSLVTNDGGTGGTLSFGAKGHVMFLSTANSLTINGNTYTLVNDIATLSSDIAANPNGAYALAANYDASADGAFANAPIATFAGKFEGLGNTISKLKIAADLLNAASNTVGLFARSTGTIADMRLSKVNVTAKGEESMSVGTLVGTNSGLLAGDSSSGTVYWQASGNRQFIDSTGGLVGENGGSIINCSSTSTIVSGHSTGKNTTGYLGGLVGWNDFSGTIANSFASGIVNGIGVQAPLAKGGQFVGGLVGVNDGAISNTAETGTVNALLGAGQSELGGLVGINNATDTSKGTIINSYASGEVSGGADAFVGGLAGYNIGSISNSYESGPLNNVGMGAIGGLVASDTVNCCVGTVSNSYWDTTTSGVSNPSQGDGRAPNFPGITGLSTTQLQAGLPAGFSSTIWGENSSINGGLPYLLALPPPA